MEVPAAVSPRPRRRGAYGLHLTGLETASRYLVDVPPTCPTLAIDRIVGAAAIGKATSTLTDDWAEFGFLDRTDRVGHARINRDPLSARFTSPAGFDDDAMIHPGLSLIAAVANRWLGRDAFHAGAFVTEAGAWAVMGAREAGKSTTLGHLTAKGLGLVTDDVLIVEDGQALAGPRCIDLRESAASWLGQGADNVLTIGQRRRWRTHVPPVPHTVPLQGWILPTWGDRVELESVAAVRRLPLLYANLALTQIPRQPEQLLRLAALPFLVFRRPRRWETMDEAATALLDRLNN
ncbi:MAG: hypothetical protein ACRDSR_01095 [Pseudonocardiaceae bacterium]